MKSYLILQGPGSNKVELLIPCYKLQVSGSGLICQMSHKPVELNQNLNSDPLILNPDTNMISFLL